MNIDVTDGNNNEDTNHVREFKTAIPDFLNQFIIYDSLKISENTYHLIVEQVPLDDEPPLFLYLRQTKFKTMDEGMYFLKYFQKLESYCNLPFAKSDITRLLRLVHFEDPISKIFEVLVFYELGEPDRIDIESALPEQIIHFLRNICILLQDLKSYNLYHHNLHPGCLVLVNQELKLSGFKPCDLESSVALNNDKWKNTLCQKTGHYRTDVFLLGVLWIKFLREDLSQIVVSSNEFDFVFKELQSISKKFKNYYGELLQKLIDVYTYPELNLEDIILAFDEINILNQISHGNNKQPIESSVIEGVEEKESIKQAYNLPFGQSILISHIDSKKSLSANTSQDHILAANAINNNQTVFPISDNFSLGTNSKVEPSIKFSKISFGGTSNQNEEAGIDKESNEENKSKASDLPKESNESNNKVEAISNAKASSLSQFSLKSQKNSSSKKSINPNIEMKARTSVSIKSSIEPKHADWSFSASKKEEMSLGHKHNNITSSSLTNSQKLTDMLPVPSSNGLLKLVDIKQMPSDTQFSNERGEESKHLSVHVDLESQPRNYSQSDPRDNKIKNKSNEKRRVTSTNKLNSIEEIAENEKSILSDFNSEKLIPPSKRNVAGKPGDNKNENTILKNSGDIILIDNNQPSKKNEVQSLKINSSVAQSENALNANISDDSSNLTNLDTVSQEMIPDDLKLSVLKINDSEAASNLGDDLDLGLEEFSINNKEVKESLQLINLMEDSDKESLILDSKKDFKGATGPLPNITNDNQHAKELRESKVFAELKIDELDSKKEAFSNDSSKKATEKIESTIFERKYQSKISSNSYVREEIQEKINSSEIAKQSHNDSREQSVLSNPKINEDFKESDKMIASYLKCNDEQRLSFFNNLTLDSKIYLFTELTNMERGVLFRALDISVQFELFTKSMPVIQQSIIEFLPQEDFYRLFCMINRSQQQLIFQKLNDQMIEYIFMHSKFEQIMIFYQFLLNDKKSWAFGLLSEEIKFMILENVDIDEQTLLLTFENFERDLALFKNLSTNSKTSVYMGLQSQTRQTVLSSLSESSIFILFGELLKISDFRFSIHEFEVIYTKIWKIVNSSIQNSVFKTHNSKVQYLVWKNENFENKMLLWSLLDKNEKACLYVLMTSEEQDLINKNDITRKKEINDTDENSSDMHLVEKTKSSREHHDLASLDKNDDHSKKEGSNIDSNTLGNDNFNRSPNNSTALENNYSLKLSKLTESVKSTLSVPNQHAVADHEFLASDAKNSSNKMSSNSFDQIQKIESQFFKNSNKDSKSNLIHESKQNSQRIEDEVPLGTKSSFVNKESIMVSNSNHFDLLEKEDSNKNVLIENRGSVSSDVLLKQSNIRDYQLNSNRSIQDLNQNEENRNMIDVNGNFSFDNVKTKPVSSFKIEDPNKEDALNESIGSIHEKFISDPKKSCSSKNSNIFVNNNEHGDICQKFQKDEICSSKNQKINLDENDMMSVAANKLTSNQDLKNLLISTSEGNQHQPRPFDKLGHAMQTSNKDTLLKNSKLESGKDEFKTKIIKDEKFGDVENEKSDKRDEVLPLKDTYSDNYNKIESVKIQNKNKEVVINPVKQSLIYDSKKTRDNFVEKKTTKSVGKELLEKNRRFTIITSDDFDTKSIPSASSNDVFKNSKDILNIKKEIEKCLLSTSEISTEAKEKISRKVNDEIRKQTIKDREHQEKKKMGALLRYKEIRGDDKSLEQRISNISREKVQKKKKELNEEHELKTRLDLLTISERRQKQRKIFEERERLRKNIKDQINSIPTYNSIPIRKSRTPQKINFDMSTSFQRNKFIGPEISNNTTILPINGNTFDQSKDLISQIDFLSCNSRRVAKDNMSKSNYDSIREDLSVNLILNNVRAMVTNKEFKEALELLNKINNLSDHRIDLLKSEILLQLGEYTGAKNVVLSALQQISENSNEKNSKMLIYKFLLLLSDVLFMQGKHKEAYEVLEPCDSLDNELIEKLNSQKVKCLLKFGSFDRIIDEYIRLERLEEVFNLLIEELSSKNIEKVQKWFFYQISQAVDNTSSNWKIFCFLLNLDNSIAPLNFKSVVLMEACQKGIFDKNNIPDSSTLTNIISLSIEVSDIIKSINMMAYLNSFLVHWIKLEILEEGTLYDLAILSLSVFNIELSKVIIETWHQIRGEKLPDFGSKTDDLLILLIIAWLTEENKRSARRLLCRLIDHCISKMSLPCLCILGKASILLNSIDKTCLLPRLSLISNNLNKYSEECKNSLGTLVALVSNPSLNMSDSIRNKPFVTDLLFVESIIDSLMSDSKESKCMAWKLFTENYFCKQIPSPVPVSPLANTQMISMVNSVECCNLKTKEFYTLIKRFLEKTVIEKEIDFDKRGDYLLEIKEIFEKKKNLYEKYILIENLVVNGVTYKESNKEVQSVKLKKFTKELLSKKICIHEIGFLLELFDYLKVFICNEIILSVAKDEKKVLFDKIIQNIIIDGLNDTTISLVNNLKGYIINRPNWILVDHPLTSILNIKKLSISNNFKTQQFQFYNIVLVSSISKYIKSELGETAWFNARVNLSIIEAINQNFNSDENRVSGRLLSSLALIPKLVLNENNLKRLLVVFLFTENEHVSDRISLLEYILDHSGFDLGTKYLCSCLALAGIKILLNNKRIDYTLRLIIRALDLISDKNIKLISVAEGNSYIPNYETLIVDLKIVSVVSGLYKKQSHDQLRLSLYSLKESLLLIADNVLSIRITKALLEAYCHEDGLVESVEYQRALRLFNRLEFGVEQKYLYQAFIERIKDLKNNFDFESEVNEDCQQILLKLLK